MNPIIGIDLGTTYSALAKLDEHGQPTIQPVDGERIMPSVIYASDPKSLVVGGHAKNKLPVEPASCLRWFKRDMGSEKTYTLPSGQEFTPVAASAAVLRKLVQEAEKETGPIEDVVITVPANFAESQRAATLEAGKQAGLNVLNIINEPTAAVLAYGLKNPIKGKILLYDLGGGTFDVTIAELKSEGEVQCLTSEGDSELGGIDFDLAIANNEIIAAVFVLAQLRTLFHRARLATTQSERTSAHLQALSP